MVRVAFTGSFYPPHEGHRHVVDQAKALGLEVIVFVANNPDKLYKKTMDERIEEAHAFFGTPVVGCELDNIGSLIHEYGCKAIVRGIRDQRDYVYEEVITKFNLTRNGLPTIYIPAPDNLKGVSSTAIRAQQYEAKNI